MDKLEQHAKLTISTFEGKLKHRGWTTGCKKWELKLLFSAYDALNIPVENRKFGLQKIKTIDEIEKINYPS